MVSKHVGSAVVVLAFVSSLSACGSGTSGPTPATPTAQGDIGPSGGTLDAGGGVSLVVPPGALASTVAIQVNVTSQAAPAGYSGASTLFEMTPAMDFALPVQVTFPVPAGTTRPTVFWSVRSDPARYDDNGGVVSADGRTITTGVMHFSGGFVAQAASFVAPGWTAGGGPVTPAQATAFLEGPVTCSGSTSHPAALLVSAVAWPAGHGPAGGICERIVADTPLGFRDLLSISIQGGTSIPGPGTYSIGQNPGGLVASLGVTHSVDCQGPYVSAASGTIVVATTSPEVTGSVDATLTDGRTVTGAFSVPPCGLSRDRCNYPPAACIRN